MARYRVVWGELALALALLVVGTLHYFRGDAVEVPYRALLLVALFYLFHLVSPSRILLGERIVPYDLLAVSGLILLAGAVAFPLLELLARGTCVIAGTLLLALACEIARNHPLRKRSVLSALTREDASHARRAALAFLLLIGFFVAIFEPFVRATLSISSFPLARPIASALAILAVLQEQDIISSRLLRRAGVALNLAVARIEALFSERKTFLLGVTGLLVARFAVEVGRTLFPALAQAIASHPDPAAAAASAVSAAGMAILFALPPYVWYKTVRVRESREHLPDWHGIVVSVALACIVCALVFPLVALSPSAAGGVEATLSEPTGSPALALGVALLVLLLCVIMGSIDDYLRRVLMVGPFFAALVFLGMYAYQAFVSAFVSSAGEALGYLSGVAALALPSLVLVFSVRALFFIAGYVSFLYEVWRE